MVSSPCQRCGGVDSLLQVCRTTWPMARCPDDPEQAALGQPLASLGFLQACLLQSVSASCSLWKLNMWQAFLSIRYKSRQDEFFCMLLTLALLNKLFGWQKNLGKFFYFFIGMTHILNVYPVFTIDSI